MDCKMELKTSAVLSDFTNNSDNLQFLFKQLICINEIDEIVVIVRNHETQELISNLKANVVSDNLSIKVVYDPDCAAVPLNYLKELNNELIYIVPSTFCFDKAVFNKMYGSVCSDEQIGLVFACLKNNKHVTELNTDEKVNFYLSHGELPDTLDCYNVGLVRKSLLTKIPYQYLSSYCFTHLCKIAENENLKFCDLTNIRLKVDNQKNIIKQYLKTSSKDFNQANSYSLTQEPKLSFWERIFSIKYANSRYYLCLFNLKLHLKVKKKITFPKNAIECTYVKENLDPLQIEKLCIFAGFTANGAITENNLSYISSLKENFDFIVYVADSKATQDAVTKLKQYCDAIIIKRHNEYDFGSYKLGYQLLKKLGLLSKANKLLLCNDSVDFIGKSQDIANLLDKSNDYEAYSLCTATFGFGEKIKSHKYTWVKFPHLQSYFLLLDRKVFNSNYFEHFLNSVTKLYNKTDIIIKYEMGLTRLFNSHNVKYSSYYPYDDTSIVNPFYMYLNPANKNAIFVKHSLIKK